MSNKREELLKKITADPNTAKIAKAVGVPFQDYVEMVLKFALNPNANLELEILPDEQVEAMGVKVPSDKDMADFINEFVAIEKELDSTDYRTKKKEVVALPLDPVKTSTDQPVDPQLAAEVLKRRNDGGK